MRALLDAVRESCVERAWSQGVELVRAGGVVAEPGDGDDELLFRIRDRGLAVSPTVTLWIDDREWDCDCPIRQDPCRHVAAAVIALARAREEGEALPRGGAQAARVGYRLRRAPEGVEFHRVLVRQGPGDGAPELPVRHTLAALTSGKVARGPERGLQVIATQADMQIEVALASQTRGVLPRALMAKIAPLLADCPDITLDDAAVKVDGAPVFLQGRLGDADDGDGFRLYLVRDRSITESFKNGVVLCGDTLRVYGENTLSRRELKELPKGRTYPRDQLAHLVTEVIPSLSRRIPFKVKTKRLPTLERARLRVEFDTEVIGETLSVLPTLVYGAPAIARVDGDRLELLGGGIPRRDHQAERSFKSKLHAALGLVPGQRSHFTGSEAVRLVERLQSYGGELRGEGPRAFRRVEGLTPKLSIGPGGVALRLLPAGDDDAIDGEVGEVGERGDFALALSELRAAAPSSVDTARAVEAWRRGESMVPLLDGGWAPLPVDWFERHGEDIAFLLAARDDDGKLAAWATPTLARLCEALNEPPPPELDALAQLVDGFTQVPPAALPEDLTATLRDYQRRGVDWLAFLREAGLGAMLADDMGLGKTLQALCVIRGRTLIVTPTSVLHGWASELARFRPGVDVHLYHGPRRALVDDDGPSVTLTTYAVLRLDVELLADHRWDTVILDESQVIKNPESQVAQAAFRLEARFRVALTGTPVENRLEELWSQFHYLNRGLLGGRREFQDLYARPIAAGLHGAAARLRERIRPFLLRRRKQEVARELPPRTEVVLRCELDPEERRLYDAIRAATREEVVARLQAGGGVLQALEALLRMRQAACHRGLVPGQDATRSSKVDLLIETLEEVVAEGHKALVFSQWTGLLDKIEPALAAASLRYTRLDGSTRDRGAVVREFQDPDGPPVLLISLKAGGVGLNLTAADHVFLLDPWWNPATEDQAADRAHRIGQTRPVLIHRLVAEETVEERILELQLHKRALADAALEGADQAATLTRDDLLALLE